MKISGPDNNTPSSSAIVMNSVSFRWPGTDTVLRFPDATLPQGEHLFLRGASGSGKSTLLSLLCGLLQPGAGELEVLGKPVARLSAGERDRLRASSIGVIFQQFNLVPYLSALANVCLPCRLSGERLAQARSRPEAEAAALLKALGIPDSLWLQPAPRLSVGQQQRVAAARALIGTPRLILADEPTSALDTLNRDRFIDLLLGLADDRGSSVVFVSHDPGLAPHFSSEITLGSAS